MKKRKSGHERVLDTSLSTLAYLFALCVLPALPLIETGSPILEHICLSVLLTLTLAKATLRPNGSDHVRLQQIHL